MDRRIGLETAIPQGMSPRSQSGSEERRQASDADREAFRQALSQDAQADSQAPEPARLEPRPFSMLATGSLPGLPGAEQAAGEAGRRLARELSASVERLLVGDGSAGRREVRLDLADEVLPGVVVSVFEEEGRLVAAFVCASEMSRERLTACASGLASELAQALSRSVMVRISTDDPEDPCLLEVPGEASP